MNKGHIPKGVNHSSIFTVVFVNASKVHSPLGHWQNSGIHHIIVLPPSLHNNLDCSLALDYQTQFLSGPEKSQWQVHQNGQCVRQDCAHPAFYHNIIIHLVIYLFFNVQATIMSLEFHPSAKVVLTAGMNKTLDLFQVRSRWSAEQCSLKVN